MRRGVHRTSILPKQEILSCQLPKSWPILACCLVSCTLDIFFGVVISANHDSVEVAWNRAEPQLRKAKVAKKKGKQAPKNLERVRVLRAKLFGEDWDSEIWRLASEELVNLIGNADAEAIRCEALRAQREGLRKSIANTERKVKSGRKGKNRFD